jgi:hypothetical protein
MYAMQYEITLPADYDMRIIRDRVASRGHLLDSFDGLALKAYGIRERGVNGSAVNQYAPFYLWDNTDGMNRFLWGGAGFAGIIDSFGRPPVHHWTGVVAERGPARHSTPVAATRHTASISPEEDLPTVVEAALSRAKELAGTPGVFVTALAIDPRHWQLMHYTLWDGPAPAGVEGLRYEVLHASTPHLSEVDGGRTW